MKSLSGIKHTLQVCAGAILASTHLVYGLVSPGTVPVWIAPAGVVVALALVMSAKFDWGWVKGCTADVCLPVAALLAACALSIAVNDIPAGFRPWERFANLALLLAAVSPLFGCGPLVELRRMTFAAVRWLLAAVVVAVFAQYVFEIFTVSEYRGFCGFFPTNLLMSYFGGVSAVLSLPAMMDARGRAERLWWLAVTAVSVQMCIVGFSRMALVSMALALTVMTVLSASRRDVGWLAGCAVAAGLIFGLSVVLDRSLGHAYVIKSEFVRACGSLTASRDSLWSDRIDEIRDSPVAGVGFCCQKHFSGPFADRDGAMSTGRIEPGSSYLEVVSMTGVAGVVAMLWVILHAVRRFWSRRWRPRDYVRTAAAGGVVFMAAAGVAEGYIFSANAVLAFMFWLSLGVFCDAGRPESVRMDG